MQLGRVGVAVAAGAPAADATLGERAGEDEAEFGDGLGDPACLGPGGGVEGHPPRFARAIHHPPPHRIQYIRVMPLPDPVTAAVIAGYEAEGLVPVASVFARAVVGAAAPPSATRARCLLWAASRLGSWGTGVGLEARPEVLLHPSTLERYVTVGMAGMAESRRNTVRADLRFVARRVVPGLWVPAPATLRRTRAKAPYPPDQVAAWFGLAAAQPTQARRHRLIGLLCLGLGAGLERAELRGVTGASVQPCAGGLVVIVAGPRARAVPVLGCYQAPLGASAAFAGDRPICGGSRPVGTTSPTLWWATWPEASISDGSTSAGCGPPGWPPTSNASACGRCSRRRASPAASGSGTSPVSSPPPTTRTMMALLGR